MPPASPRRLPGMVSYYLTYGEPPRRRSPLWLLLALLIGTLTLAALIAGAILMLMLAADDEVAASDTEPVPYAVAIPTILQENSDTVFLVDVSASIEESGNLAALRTALAGIALGDAHPGISRSVSSSRLALMTFANDAEMVIPMGSLADDDSMRNQWLVTAGSLETKPGTGTFVYDAVDQAHEFLMNADVDSNSPVIVLFSDGIDGDVGECRPATAADGRARYCVGASGDPILCEDMPPEVQVGSGVRMVCKAIHSEVSPTNLLSRLQADNERVGLTIHVVAYGSANSHGWLRRVARDTDGKYIVAEP